MSFERVYEAAHHGKKDWYGSSWAIVDEFDFVFGFFYAQLFGSKSFHMWSNPHF